MATRPTSPIGASSDKSTGSATISQAFALFPAPEIHGSPRSKIGHPHSTMLASCVQFCTRTPPPTPSSTAASIPRQTEFHCCELRIWLILRPANLGVRSTKSGKFSTLGGGISLLIPLIGNGQFLQKAVLARPRPEVKRTAYPALGARNSATQPSVLRCFTETPRRCRSARLGGFEPDLSA